MSKTASPSSAKDNKLSIDGSAPIATQIIQPSPKITLGYVQYCFQLIRFSVLSLVVAAAKAIFVISSSPYRPIFSFIIPLRTIR